MLSQLLMLIMISNKGNQLLFDREHWVDWRENDRDPSALHKHFNRLPRFVKIIQNTYFDSYILLLHFPKLEKK